ncbi:MAG: 16S rRNA processing protein RimM [Deltaproteobacteria bacterium]|nr:MAG: 16S rRNA processing protein RimM [Deltaproteobacteria bacterium]TMQ23061.1 MAG: 16S rRNA processing protein RimM [Deltaproteobacteria bacterium]
MTTRGDPRIEIGRITRAHGIRGEVAITTYDPEPDLLGSLDALWVGGTLRRVLRARNTHRGWLVLFESIATRNEAEALRGQVIEVDRVALALGDDDVLLDDLVGCRVQRVDGTPWGTIAAVEGDLQDRLVIHDGEIERQLPLVGEFVTAIDLEAGVVTVDPPDGLPEHKIAP